MNTAPPPARSLRVGLPALLVAFAASCYPYFALQPGSDSVKNLWLISHVPASTFLTDPLAAGYVYRFFFEPVWAVLYFVDIALAPILGVAAYHIVNLIGVGGTAAVIAKMTRDAATSSRTAAAHRSNSGRSNDSNDSNDPQTQHQVDCPNCRYVPALAYRALPLGAAALYLFSPVSWLDVAFPPVRNYVFGTLFGLLAVQPFWRAYLGGSPATATQVMTSAAFYGLAVASKEAVAALPLLLFGLDVVTRGSVMRSAARFLPHTLLLAGLVVWRFHILGGPGGYWMEPTLTWSNLVLALPMLSDFLWGTALPLPVMLLAWLLWDRRGLGLALLAFVATMSPFVLAGDLTAREYYPFASTRFTLFWALAMVLGAHAVAKAKPPALALLALLAVPLTLQWLQRDLVTLATDRLLPKHSLADLAPRGPLTIVSNDSMSLAHEHQMMGADRPPLAAYQMRMGYVLDRALGFEPAADTEMVGVPLQHPIPEIVPLELKDSRIWADNDGHLHIRLAAGVERGLTLTWVHVNGPTRWLVTLLVGRRDIDMPLTYSVQSIILSRMSTASRSWPTHVWESPFFRDVYP